MSKSSAIAIAARYATAIFALATEAKKESVVVAELSELAAAVSDNKELATALGNPLVGRTTKSEILAAIAKKANKVTLQALDTIASQGRADLLPAIALQLRAKLAEANGELVAQVESARALPASVQAQLVASLSKATGKTVQLELKENPELLGGVAIQIGSKRLDASLSAALSTMKRDLLALNA